MLYWVSLKKLATVLLLGFVCLGAFSNNVGYTQSMPTDELLWSHQVNVRIDAVDFEYDYKFERSVIEQVSIAYLAISRHFYVDMDENNYLDFNIRLVEDYSRFLDIQNKEVGHIISHTGYYSLDSNQMTVLKKLSDIETFKTLKHEACHRVLHQNSQNRLRWLNEGISENCEFASYDYDTKEVVINSNYNNHKYVKKIAKSEKLIPLNDLLDWGGEGFQFSGNVMLKQSQSGEFIFFLLSLPEASYWLSDMLKQDGRNGDIHQVQIQDRLIDLQNDFENWLLF